jgi:hypothetical protein
MTAAKVDNVIEMNDLLITYLTAEDLFAAYDWDNVLKLTKSAVLKGNTDTIGLPLDFVSYRINLLSGKANYHREYFKQADIDLQLAANKMPGGRLPGKNFNFYRTITNLRFMLLLDRRYYDPSDSNKLIKNIEFNGNYTGEFFEMLKILPEDQFHVLIKKLPEEIIKNTYTIILCARMYYRFFNREMVYEDNMVYLNSIYKKLTGETVNFSNIKYTTKETKDLSSPEDFASAKIITVFMHAMLMGSSTSFVEYVFDNLITAGGSRDLDDTGEKYIQNVCLASKYLLTRI